MKKNLKKSFHVIFQVILWTIGVFFILGGISYLSKAPLAGVLMLLLGLVIIPLFWNLFTKKKSKKSLRYVRLIGSVLLFSFAVAATPVTPSPPAQTVKSVASQPTKTVNQPAQQVANKDQKLSSIKFENNTYTLNGSGLGNTDYTVAVSNGPEIKVSTDSNGNFKKDLPASTPAFGSIALTRDTNGAWFGGTETYDTQYFVLNSKNTNLTKDLPKPVVLGIGGSSKYEISGYYLAKKDLLLKSGNDVIASAKVDDSGRYKFENIALQANYTPVSIYEKVSTGWFSSREDKLSDLKYIDTEKHQLLAALPIIVKELSSTSAVPFTSRTVEDASIQKGQTSVTQAGVNGEKKDTYKVTYKGNDEINRELIASEITKQPVENITTVGTYVYVAPQTPVKSTVRTGAICRDGWRSSATGSGACSHHGGVAQWLY